jgi:hypothetical protein
MRSRAPGKSTSGAEVTSVDRHGLWLLVREQEFFLPFSEFPWFREARLASILKVELVHENHLYWPELDIDLTLDSIKDPSAYPLIWQD